MEFQRQCEERYQRKNLRELMCNLDDVIKVGITECLHTVSQEGRIPPLEEHNKSSPEMSSSLSLWLPSVPGQGSRKLIHLSFSCWVPTGGGTLRQDNCQLIGQSLIELAQQALEDRN